MDVATDNNGIYTIDAVSGTVARFVPEDGRRARIREVAPITRMPTSGTSASESPVFELGAWATRATTGRPIPFEALRRRSGSEA